MRRAESIRIRVAPNLKPPPPSLSERRIHVPHGIAGHPRSAPRRHEMPMTTFPPHHRWGARRLACPPVRADRRGFRLQAINRDSRRRESQKNTRIDQIHPRDVCSKESTNPTASSAPNPLARRSLAVSRERDSESAAHAQRNTASCTTPNTGMELECQSSRSASVQGMA